MNNVETSKTERMFNNTLLYCIKRPNEAKHWRAQTKINLAVQVGVFYVKHRSRSKIGRWGLLVERYVAEHVSAF